MGYVCLVSFDLIWNQSHRFCFVVIHMILNQINAEGLERKIVRPIPERLQNREEDEFQPKLYYLKILKGNYSLQSPNVRTERNTCMQLTVTRGWRRVTATLDRTHFGRKFLHSTIKVN